ncbi:hypothetical protein SDC9_162914 [bioreactor metagenome]|uniref:Uncharacterized protein n=1 Tax=bioreactor metagenome TaxID=1076179 RepID=A0A645FNQ7_9ZZZZ
MATAVSRLEGDYIVGNAVLLESKGEDMIGLNEDGKKYALMLESLSKYFNE